METRHPRRRRSTRIPRTGRFTAWAGRQREEEDRGFRLALGSFVEEYANRVSIIQRRDAYEKAVGTGVGRDRTAQALQRKAGKDPNDSSAFVQVAGFEHPYPATKILWSPDKTARRDLLATTGDYLRVWSVPDQRERLRRRMPRAWIRSVPPMADAARRS